LRNSHSRQKVIEEKETEQRLPALLITRVKVSSLSITNNRFSNADSQKTLPIPEYSTSNRLDFFGPFCIKTKRTIINNRICRPLLLLSEAEGLYQDKKWKIKKRSRTAPPGFPNNTQQDLQPKHYQ